VGVGAELFTLEGYAAVFDSAIEPYLIDQGSTSTTAVTAASPAANVQITVAANPAITGANVNVYGSVFRVGSHLVVDVGPQQEVDIIVQAISGLVLTVALANAHGPTVYPVVLKGGEWVVRDIIVRLDAVNAQLKGYAPTIAGLKKADETEFYASQKGRRGQKNAAEDLYDQRDMARRDLCTALGIPNLWEMRGKRQGDAGSLEFGRY
jgi:hypothetical protein